jgi:hypothetical protein
MLVFSVESTDDFLKNSTDSMKSKKRKKGKVDDTNVTLLKSMIKDNPDRYNLYMLYCKKVSTTNSVLFTIANLVFQDIKKQGPSVRVDILVDLLKDRNDDNFYLVDFVCEILAHPNTEENTILKCFAIIEYILQMKTPEVNARERLTKYFNWKIRNGNGNIFISDKVAKKYLEGDIRLILDNSIDLSLLIKIAESDKVTSAVLNQLMHCTNPTLINTILKNPNISPSALYNYMIMNFKEAIMLENIVSNSSASPKLLHSIMVYSKGANLRRVVIEVAKNQKTQPKTLADIVENTDYLINIGRLNREDLVILLTHIANHQNTSIETQKSLLDFCIEITNDNSIYHSVRHKVDNLIKTLQYMTRDQDEVVCVSTEDTA